MAIYYTKTKTNKWARFFNIIFIIILLIISTFVLFWFVICGAWCYADWQRSKVDKYLDNNEGILAINALKHSLYIVGDKTPYGDDAYTIGDIYAFGFGGVKQDDGKALYWYKHDYGGFYLTSFIYDKDEESLVFYPKHFLNIAMCYAGVDCSDIYFKPKIKPNPYLTIIWLNRAADFGVNDAQNINRECLITKGKILNESVIFNCIKDRMLDMKTSNK